MAEETKVLGPAKEEHGILATILSKVGLRGLMYNLGGRKVVTGGGALGVCTLIVNSEMGDWPKAIACFGVGIIAAATVISIAMEDKKGK